MLEPMWGQPSCTVPRGLLEADTLHQSENPISQTAEPCVGLALWMPTHLCPTVDSSFDSFALAGTRRKLRQLRPSICDDCDD